MTNNTVEINISPDSIADHHMSAVVDFYRAAARRDWPGADVTITTDISASCDDPMVDGETVEGWSNAAWGDFLTEDFKFRMSEMKPARNETWRCW